MRGFKSLIGWLRLQGIRGVSDMNIKKDHIRLASLFYTPLMMVAIFTLLDATKMRSWSFYPLSFILFIPIVLKLKYKEIKLLEINVLCILGFIFGFFIVARNINISITIWLISLLPGIAFMNSAVLLINFAALIIHKPSNNALNFSQNQTVYNSSKRVPLKTIFACVFFALSLLPIIVYVYPPFAFALLMQLLGHQSGNPISYIFNIGIILYPFVLISCGIKFNANLKKEETDKAMFLAMLPLGYVLLMSGLFMLLA